MYPNKPLFPQKNLGTKHYLDEVFHKLFHYFIAFYKEFLQSGFIFLIFRTLTMFSENCF